MKCNFCDSRNAHCFEEATSFYMWVDWLPGVYSDVKLYLRCNKHNDPSMAIYPTLMQISHEEALILEVMES